MLTTACTTKTTYTYNFVSVDEAVQKQLFKAGDHVSIYTDDDKEIAMYLSYYDLEKFVGYVTYIHEKHANRYQCFDENDGITENIKEVPVSPTSKIVFIGQSSSIRINEDCLSPFLFLRC